MGTTSAADLILVAISGIAWTVVYVTSIYLGFRQKTYCMPLWALGLNICWELIYSFDGISGGHVGAQGVANTVWACCDIAIVVTYFMYGRKWMPAEHRNLFVPYSVAAFVTCLLMQLAFYLQIPMIASAQYSAFAQNVLMSVLFVVMLKRRGGTEGQSMVIAVAKWLGTLAPTIQQGIVDGHNIYILLCGLLCSIWDITYIVLLAQAQRAERITAASAQA